MFVYDRWRTREQQGQAQPEHGETNTKRSEALMTNYTCSTFETVYNHLIGFRWVSSCCFLIF